MKKVFLYTGNWGSDDLQLYYSFSHLFIFNGCIWMLMVHDGSLDDILVFKQKAVPGHWGTPGFESWLHHFTCSLIHLFNKYLLGACYVLSSVLVVIPAVRPQWVSQSRWAWPRLQNVGSASHAVVMVRLVWGGTDLDPALGESQTPPLHSWGSQARREDMKWLVFYCVC